MELQQTPIIEDTLWEAVLNRNASFEGKLFYGVRSTSIYCRPTCSSRRPNRNQVCFFQSPQEAETAGFRPCKRCQPQYEKAPNLTQAKILAVCRYIEEQVDRIPTLSQLSFHFGISPSYLQKEFKRVIGLSPFQYANALRSDRFKQRLQQGDEIVHALYDTGYGSSSRLYEKASQQLGMTPKTYRCSGKGMHIVYTIVPCSLGYLLVGTTDKGICAVKLGDEINQLERIFIDEFNQAQIVHDDNLHGDWIQTILSFIAGDAPHLDLPLDIRGTAFQKQVWQALQKIPYGKTCTYADIAREIGKPDAVRGVGTACGANPTALIVPCHRVLRTDGTLAGYHWGILRKQKLLAQEAKRTGGKSVSPEK